MLKKAPDRFDFFVNAHRDLTHGTRKNAQATVAKFTVMLQPYRETQKLAGVLFQFPPTFKCSWRSEDYVRGW